jgi:hypothetical protein
MSSHIDHLSLSLAISQANIMYRNASTVLNRSALAFIRRRHVPIRQTKCTILTSTVSSADRSCRFIVSSQANNPANDQSLVNNHHCSHNTTDNGHPNQTDSQSSDLSNGLSTTSLPAQSMHQSTNQSTNQSHTDASNHLTIQSSNAPISGYLSRNKDYTYFGYGVGSFWSIC